MSTLELSQWIVIDATDLASLVLAPTLTVLDVCYGLGHNNCPKLWTVEFTEQVSACLHPNGRLVTYGAAAVRVASGSLLGQ